MRRSAVLNGRDLGREVFFEPHTRLAGVNGEYPIQRRRWLLAAEMFAAIMCISDAAATVIRLGWERYVKKHWRSVFLTTAVLVLLDSTEILGIRFSVCEFHFFMM